MITMVALGVTNKGGENVEIVVKRVKFTGAMVGIMDIVMAYGTFVPSPHLLE